MVEIIMSHRQTHITNIWLAMKEQHNGVSVLQHQDLSKRPKIETPCSQSMSVL